MKPPILITAFPPFLLGPSTYLFGNPSEKMLKLLRDAHGNECSYQMLPVNDQAVPLLEKGLDQNPAGVLMMGFDLLSSSLILGCGVNLELGADVAKKYITSNFAVDIAKRANARGITTGKRISSYYCNKVYAAALLWSGQHNNIPVAFLHMGYAKEDLQLAAVESILQDMEQYGEGEQLQRANSKVGRRW
jgi:hypothetical protein